MPSIEGYQSHPPGRHVGSALLSMMQGLLPPSSRLTGVSCAAPPYHSSTAARSKEDVIEFLVQECSVLLRASLHHSDELGKAGGYQFGYCQAGVGCSEGFNTAQLPPRWPYQRRNTELKGNSRRHYQGHSVRFRQNEAFGNQYIRGWAPGPDRTRCFKAKRSSARTIPISVI